MDAVRAKLSRQFIQANTLESSVTKILVTAKKLVAA